jgi:hypothetical protein
MATKRKADPKSYDGPADGPTTVPVESDDRAQITSFARLSSTSAFAYLETRAHANQQSAFDIFGQPDFIDRPPVELDHGHVFADETIPSVTEEAKALFAIEHKASALGHAKASALSEITAVPGGYFVRYPGQDIYYSTEWGAHEVHGDIKSKYDSLPFAGGLLGVPITDETKTPDGRGRFNHFARGSIYWTPTTVPQTLRGAIRDTWAAQGWERGALGYPVSDQYRLPQSSSSDPIIEVCWFENGAIVSDTKIAKVACFVEVTADNLRMLVRKMVDKELHKSPDNVGLHAESEIRGVRERNRGPRGVEPRIIEYRLHGFRDMGMLFPDVDFTLDINLGFESVPYTGGAVPPPYMTLVASLPFAAVTSASFDVTTAASGKVVIGVRDGIQNAFYPSPWPDPNHPEVPYGSIFVATFATGYNPGLGLIDLIGVLVAADGSLRFMLNPLTPPSPPNAPQPSFINPDYCEVRRTVAQVQVDTFIRNAMDG